MSQTCFEWLERTEVRVKIGSRDFSLPPSAVLEAKLYSLALANLDARGEHGAVFNADGSIRMPIVKG